MSDALSKDSNSGLLAYLADQILAWLQKRCCHPGQMIVVDILENSAEHLSVAYCRRCGAVRVDHYAQRGSWRLPDPNLWRGK